MAASRTRCQFISTIKLEVNRVIVHKAEEGGF